jgi:penicillin-binding protein 2
MKENNKSKFLYTIILITISVLVARLVFIQIVQGNYYRELSTYRSIRIITEEPLRGRILDRNGVVLAENVPSYDLVVVPEDIKDKNRELNFISSITGIKTADIQTTIDKSGLPDYSDIIIKKDISTEEMIKIEEHTYEIPGVKVVLSSKRHYTFGEIGEAFLGFVGKVSETDLNTDEFYNQNDVIGKQGVELQYERDLRGEKGKKEALVDVFGREKKIIYEESPVMGNDVYLTIDINVQKNLEKIIDDKNGVAIAMDPTTGEILAMVSHPTFDPNLLVNGISQKAFEQILNEDAFLNRAIQSHYPPGSTFKPMTLISALASKTIDPKTTIYCGNSINIGGRIFKDWIYPSAFGYQNPVEGLANSSDVFFYRVGLMTGIDQIDKYANLFKLGDTTGIDLPFEISGLIPSSSWKLENIGENWYIGDTANTSIGQGYVLVTPIELITFYQAIANNGIQFTPHFLLKVISPQNKVIFEYNKTERLNLTLPQEILDTVKNGMEGLSNKPDMSIVRVNGISVCSKTGTAEVGANSVDHWLVSFAPKENPEILGLVFFENSKFPSSHSLAPFMRDLLKNFFE